jgi:hypothetical protein
MRNRQDRHSTLVSRPKFVGVVLSPDLRER